MTFKDLLASIPTGVFLLTSKSNSGDYCAAVISSVICLDASENNGLVLFTLAKKSSSFLRIQESEGFSLDLLSDSSAQTAQKYSTNSGPIESDMMNFFEKSQCGNLHFKSHVATLCCTISDYQFIAEKVMVFANVTDFSLVLSNGVLGYFRRSFIQVI
jgi:flavin reductase (DIM6/NTAB) family NADH-FMN oxidoreductase RutF